MKKTLTPVVATLAGCVDHAETSPSPTHTSPTQQAAGSETCVGKFGWGAGSVHPDYYYAWSATVNADHTLDFTYSTDYFGVADPLVEEKGIKISADEHTALCEAITELEELSLRKDGGQPFWWDLTAGGRQFKGSTDESSDYWYAEKLAVQLIGQDMFDDVRKQHETLIEQEGN